MLGQDADHPSIKIIEEYHADGISVLRLEDPTVLGCVSLWRIDRHNEQTKFFTCVINIAKLREELAQRRLTLDAWANSGAGAMADNIREQLQGQANISATHYWLTGWSRCYHGVDKNGRAYHSHRLYDMRLLAVDLGELPGILPSDRYAKYFARSIVQRLAANEFREFHHHQTWQSAVKSIEWDAWLSGMAATYINQSHILQPVKRPLAGRRKK